MHATVSILAHNECHRIESALNHLLQQSVFTQLQGASAPALTAIDLLVVANGCTDATVNVARNVLAAHPLLQTTSRVTWRIADLDVAGKSNAWNWVVHEGSLPHTDLFAFLDADIEFGHDRSFEQTLQALHNTPSAVAASDVPVKRFDANSRNPFLSFVSKKASKQSSTMYARLCGQFYCAWSHALRDIWMPRGLSGEDGYLALMLVTRGFRKPADQARIVCAHEAFHYYQGLDSLDDIIQHQTRMLLGTYCNKVLCWDTLCHVTDPLGDGAGALVERLNKGKPNWYPEFLSNHVKTLRRAPIGLAFILNQRFEDFRLLPPWDRIKKTPLRLAGCLLDFLAARRANDLLIRQRAAGYW